MADTLRPGSLAWYAAHEGKRGQYAQPQSYSEFAGEQEPGYGADPRLPTMYEWPQGQMFGSGVGAVTQGALGYSIAANAPWWAKPIAAWPFTNAAADAADFLRAYQQVKGTHPTQDHQRQWEGILRAAMERLPPR